ncbi:MAG: hypothetical protein KDA73_15200 [Rhodobacteraceae bacterium]|nr:hypothetical protein [Paracoccaceae bacterium]
MKFFIPLAFGTICAAGVAGADQARQLSLTEMDLVAAGTAIASAGAVGGGPSTLTATHTAAVGSYAAGPAPGIDSYAYAAGGTASGYSTSNNISTGAVAATNSSSTHNYTTNRSWTVNSGPVSISSAFSHTAGNNGVWFFGGP